MVGVLRGYVYLERVVNVFNESKPRLCPKGFRNPKSPIEPDIVQLFNRWIDMRAAPEIVYMIILATIFFVLLVTVIIVTVWRYYSRKRAHEMEVIQFGQTLLETRLEIQEHTFRAISEELHDNLGQVLSLAKLQLNTANINNPIQAQEKVNGAIDLVSQAIYSIRDLAKTMHSESITRVGLTGALETEARLIEKTGMLQPVFQVSGTPVPLDDNKTLIVFRIVQEALHNVVKHADATAGRDER